MSLGIDNLRVRVGLGLDTLAMQHFLKRLVVGGDAVVHDEELEAAPMGPRSQAQPERDSRLRASLARSCPRVHDAP